MSQPMIDVAPDITHLMTEDDTPVDNLPSEKQQRLLTEPLYSSWEGPGAGRPFLAAANVGVFYLARNPAIVPDMFLSLDVEVAPDWWEKKHRSYFLWEFGKPPDLAIEIVSNTVGEEDGEKKRRYARMRVSYYVIYDPQRQVMPDTLTVYRLNGFEYDRQAEAQFPDLGLGLTLWEGVFEGKQDTWLRWTDARRQLVPTGRERAEQERQRAEQEHHRAEQERMRAEQEHQRADQESQRAEIESQRAEQERQRAEQESQRAEQERAAKEATLHQLEQERQRAERMAELLRQMGRDPDQL
ncbi:MAG: Uma2 family endonuclease [Blastocatellia bacterium]